MPLSDIIPSTTRRYTNIIPSVRVSDNYFMNTFLPSTITTKWNKLDLSICNSIQLKCRLLQFLRPLENSVFTCHNPIGTKYLTRLRPRFSHLLYHKFKHGFLDAVDPHCSCSIAIENTVCYFLHCPNFSITRNPANIYLFKVNNRRKRCEICSKLTIKTPERSR